MKIITWKASDDAPTAHRWLARFLTDKGFLPVFCTAKTEAEVRAKAQAFWDSETDKWAKRDGRKPASAADAVIERMGRPDPVEKGVASPDDDIHMIDGYGPMTTAEVAELQAEFSAPTNDDLDDLLG